jgi:putative Mg2+ transporter-C (MgtC) family protein
MQTLLAYWSHGELVTNGLILLHLIGSLLLGLSIGYERAYHGRAAGMRTYALVCMSATALTVLNGFPGSWYGGQEHNAALADPTRVIQGIMTGIGFLGAGVIMKEGFTIRGLSTAASIWMTASIGVLLGVGFYAAAITAAALTVGVLSGFRWLEKILPHQQLSHLSLTYPRQQVPGEAAIAALLQGYGFTVADWSYQLNAEHHFVYQLVLNTVGDNRSSDLAQCLTADSSLLAFSLSPSRN